MIWVFVFLYLYTWPNTTATGSYSTPFSHFETSPLAIFCLFGHVFGLFWNISFIYGTYVFLLNGSCVYWYFSHADREEHDSKLPHPLRFINNILMIKLLLAIKISVEALFQVSFWIHCSRILPDVVFQIVQCDVRIFLCIFIYSSIPIFIHTSIYFFLNYKE